MSRPIDSRGGSLDQYRVGHSLRDPFRDSLAASHDEAPGDARATPLPAPVRQTQAPPQGARAVVVTADRPRLSGLTTPRATTTVSADDLRERLPQTTPDALEEAVGVVVQKTNQGGGSPVIRGRTGKEILLLIDGQRFNDATFRRNNQYLNTIDLGAVDHLHVVRGPTAVRNGSDAIGGAVDVITRRYEPLGVDAIGGRVLAQFDSANHGFVGHLGLEGELAGTGFTAGVTGKDFGDLRAGSRGDPVGAVDRDGAQDPTAYEEFDLSLSLQRALNDTTTLDFLTLYSQQEDVPRSDRLIASDNQPTAPDLVRAFDPQILRWYALRISHEDPEHPVAAARASVTFNNPEEHRRRIRTSAPTIELRERDENEIWGGSAEITLAPGRGHRITAGLQANHQTVRSSRTTTDLATNTTTVDANGRFPDDATYESYGVYVEDEWSLTDCLTWTGGVRYSAFRTAFDLGGLTVGPVGPFGRLEETYDDVTFATGLQVEVVEDETHVYGSAARGFRAPSLDDLATVGDFASGERVPNLDVDPESVWAFELGAKHVSRRIAAEAAAAVAFYDDLLDNRFAFTQGGTDFSQIDNVGRAVVYSLEGGVSWVVRPSDGEMPAHTVYGNGFLNIGRNTTADEPVSKVPPPQGRVGYRLDAADNHWFAEAFVAGALQQNNLSAADRADPRFASRGTPAWWTLNLRAGADLTESVRASLALENLLDERYRVHGSGIDAPGFNAVAQVELRF